MEWNEITDIHGFFPESYFYLKFPRVVLENKYRCILKRLHHGCSTSLVVHAPSTKREIIKVVIGGVIFI